MMSIRGAEHGGTTSSSRCPISALVGFIQAHWRVLVTVLSRGRSAVYGRRDDWSSRNSPQTRRRKGSVAPLFAGTRKGGQRAGEPVCQTPSWAAIPPRCWAGRRSRPDAGLGGDPARLPAAVACRLRDTLTLRNRHATKPHADTGWRACAHIRGRALLRRSGCSPALGLVALNYSGQEGEGLPAEDVARRDHPAVSPGSQSAQLSGRHGVAIVEEVLAGVASDAQHFIRKLKKSGQWLGPSARHMSRVRGICLGLRINRVGGICRQRVHLPLRVCEWLKGATDMAAATAA
jgi:hypothetical protein